MRAPVLPSHEGHTRAIVSQTEVSNATPKTLSSCPPCSVTTDSTPESPCNQPIIDSLTKPEGSKEKKKKKGAQDDRAGSDAATFPPSFSSAGPPPPPPHPRAPREKASPARPKKGKRSTNEAPGRAYLLNHILSHDPSSFPPLGHPLTHSLVLTRHTRPRTPRRPTGRTSPTAPATPSACSP